MTEEQLFEMKDFAPHFTCEIYEDLTYGLRNPTGIWADFQLAHRYYNDLTYTIGMIIGNEHLPFEPRNQDYSDLDNTKTDHFPKIANVDLY